MAHREVETKHDLAADSELPTFAVLEGVAAVGKPESHRLSATYYDTDDLRLVAAGVTLRRRTGGNDAGWHLKIPSDGAKHEVRTPLTRSRKGVPKRLRRAVVALVRDQRLTRIATIETRRTEHSLLDPAGRVLAEVADDHVTAVARHPGAPDGPRSWREVEVELVDGDERLLDEASDLLEDAGAQPSTARSKLTRALGDRMPGPRIPPPSGRSDPVAALVQARLADQLDALLVADPAVREDLPDGVHAMRVAARRLRSALATYRPFLGRDVTEPIRDDLKWLGGLLGDARDPEVQREHLLGLLDDVVADEPDVADGPDATDDIGQARARLAAAFDERYRAAHERCLAALSSKRYLGLLDRLDQLVTRPAWLPEAERPISDAGLERVRHEWDRLGAPLDRLDERSELGDRDRDRALHEVRKAARRLRYAVEPLRPPYGKDAKRLVKRLKRLQDVLGLHHDSVIARARLHRIADDAAAAGENALVYGVLHARETDQARRLEGEVDDELASTSAQYDDWPG